MREQTKNSKLFLFLTGLCGITAYYVVTNFAPTTVYVEMFAMLAVFGTLYSLIAIFSARKNATAISAGVIFLLILNRLGSLDLLTFTLLFLIVIGIFLV